MKPGSIKPLHRIKKLIQEGEGLQLDFKFEINDAKKIARTFSAFSNSAGGKILVGVKDNGKISGIQSDEEAYMVESAACLYCKPKVSFSIKKWMVEGKWILEVDIPRSDEKPHLAPDEKGKWTSYLRVGDQNIKANRVLVSLWRNQRNKRSAFISYQKEEKVLFDYLREHGDISYTKFQKIARIGPAQAEKILVNLMQMEAIEIVVTQEATVFRKKNSLDVR